MKLICGLFFTIFALQGVLGQDEDDWPHYPDADDSTILGCIQGAIDEASTNHPDTEVFFAETWETIESLISQRRTCLDMPLSDPPRPWEEAARDLCTLTFRTRLLFEINSFRNTMMDGGIANAADIVDEVRVSFDECMTA